MSVTAPLHDPEAESGGLRARQPRAIHNALTVLEEVARQGPGVTAQEISTSLGMPRATAYRLITLLVQDEYLVRMPDLRGFALGRKVVELAHLVAPPRPTEAVASVLAGLRSSIRGGVHLARYEGERLTVVDSDPDFPLSDEARIRRDLTSSAMGRLLLVDLSARGVVVEATAALTPAELLELRRATASAGFASQVGMLLPGQGCIAVPIRQGPELIGSLALSLPAARVAAADDTVRTLAESAARLAPLLA